MIHRNMKSISRAENLRTKIRFLISQNYHKIRVRLRIFLCLNLNPSDTNLVN